MIRRAVSFLLILIFTSITCFSQDSFLVTGRVVDSKTRESLAFVNIVINNNSSKGGTTDIDGKFSLRSSQPVKTLTLSYVGYEPLVVQPGSQTKGIIIQMTQKDIDLREVEILPGINPAHRIIRNVIDNRDINDPEKVTTFSYTAYDKTVFTADNDTTLKGDFAALVDTSMMQGANGIGIGFSMQADSMKTDTAMKDSTSQFIEKLISSQYLFLMENVTKRKFMAPDKNYNKVVATKMSGFKDPILVFLATQIQSFSFYKPIISIMMKDYINPIGSGSFSKYFFKIEDTTYVGKDTVFILSFRPRKGTNFDGMKGIISINTHHWAIQNVTAEPYPNTGGFMIRIHQLYELIDGAQWFPVQLNTDVAFNNMRIGKYKAVGSGRSYIRDIVLNPELVRREFNHLDVEVDKDATSRSEPYWNQYRVDSLSRKDRQTYKVLDSVGAANNFDKMAKTLQTLLTGRIPWGPVDLDINRFLNYNTYEGLVIGAGLHTNDRLSDWFKIGGFYQYAFGVSTSKYGADVRFLVNRRHDISIKASGFYDLVESGGVSYPTDYESILSGNFVQLMLKKFDRTQSFNFSVDFRALKYVLFNAGISNNFKKSTTDDLATFEGNATILQDQFRFTTITAGFKWAYGEKFIQTSNNKISLGTNYPIVWFEYTRGIKNFLDGEFDYDRFDLKIRKTFNLKYLGKFTVQFNGGLVDQPIPATNLYYSPASYRLFTLFAPNSFGTMRNNEFLSSKYASLYLYHDFGYLLFKGKKWFHPEFALSQNIGFGWLDNPENYTSISIYPKVMNLGYYESGLLINNLINLKIYTIGIGAFYRWGPYSFDQVGDNFAYKISMIFPF
ncbi:MAG: DUF5686 family protein [Bacteroidetes bacterium]|nr:DUF5686 family protein [Bacteroidota bacterium]